MYMIAIPGWDSVEAAAKLHRWFEIAGFVALALLLVFEVLAYIYGNRRDELVIVADQAGATERRQHQEQADQQRNAEVAEANRRAAAAQAQAEQLRQQAAPRALSPTERHQIVAFLAGKPTGVFIIKATIVTADARNYGEQIADAFRASGWTVTVQNVMFSGSNIMGLWITVKDGNAPPQAAGILQHALAAGGITARAEYDSTMPDEVWLSIGAK
jgi:hypothetical protein